MRTKVNNEWRIKYNNELYELYSESDIVAFIKIGLLQWAAQLIRMEDDRPAIRAFQSKSGVIRLHGRLRARWEDNTSEDARIIGVRIWTAKAKSKDDWNRISRVCCSSDDGDDM